MVSKLFSTYAGSSLRSAVSLSSTPISVTPPFATAGFIHLSSLTIATPSLTIARRNPAVSASFFTAFISGMGDGA